MIGKKITKLEEIAKLAAKGKSIYHVRWGKPTSAAWLVGMPLRTILGYIRASYLYEYKKKNEN
jgi:hypothetical protein